MINFAEIALEEPDDPKYEICPDCHLTKPCECDE
jgi:hypothetical protein